ncbi:MAG TPA: hypothetical protein P5102_11185, partial [Candidatus Competibacteraceae bacterium]|nr:hypothetical protein [Candidatus Competibacteraceae bacterium]
KHDAVRRVTAELEQEGPLVTIGAGDSLTDLPFMRICDFALTPRDSQIQRETWEDSTRPPQPLPRGEGEFIKGAPSPLVGEGGGIC